MFVAWVSAARHLHKKVRRSHQAYRMEGVRPRQRLHETPVFMRVRTEPCRSKQCGLGVGKVNGKTRDFHSFLRFLCLKRRFWAEIAGFWPLEWVSGEKSREKQGYDADQCSPKSTFFLGAKSAAIGVLSASTMDAASWKWRMITSANLRSSAVFGGRVAANPHWRHWTRSRAG
jgi:hypothetical protein